MTSARLNQSRSNEVRTEIADKPNSRSPDEEAAIHHALEQDEIGPYIELCFADHMSSIVLSEEQRDGMQEGVITTLRVYASEAHKRAAVVNEDDHLIKRDIKTHQTDVAMPTREELRIWIANDCFKTILIKGI